MVLLQNCLSYIKSNAMKKKNIGATNTIIKRDQWQGNFLIFRMSINKTLMKHNLLDATTSLIRITLGKGLQT